MTTNINKNDLKESFDKYFNPLENKIDNLSKLQGNDDIDTHTKFYANRFDNTISTTNQSPKLEPIKEAIRRKFNLNIKPSFFGLPKDSDKWWWDEGGASKQIKDFNYGNEYWKERLQKSMPHLSQLTSNDIFDITTTEMPYYNAMIQKGHIAGNRDPLEYFKTNKGLTFEIVYMSPTQYLEESYKIHRKFSIDYGIPQIPFETYLKTNIDPELINEYVERTLEGSRMPMPVLDYDKLTQEGRHRAVVAMELGVDEIPVLVVRTYEE